MLPSLLSLRHTPSKLRLGVSLGALLGASLFGATAVQAQTASSSVSASAPGANASATTPAPAAPPPSTTPKASADDDITTVTVTAVKPLIEHKIDRDVYDVKQDPQAATGAASDVLNNVPGVTVDNDGTVSLRGNSGVQVYVNGKKSAQMSGDNRSFTLQSMSADDIDTIEVIPNPGAAFGSDSAGGIINIVMKRGRALKPQTGFNLTAGDMGRAGIGMRTGFATGKWHVNANLNINHGTGGNGRGGMRGGGSGGSSPKSYSRSERFRYDPVTGAVRREDDTNSVSKSNNNNLSATVSAEYDFTDSMDLTGEFNYNSRRTSSVGTQETLSYDGTHSLLSDIARLNTSSAPTESMDYHLTFDSRGPVGSTEDFKMVWSHSGNLNDGQTITRTLSHQPLTADTYTTFAQKTKSGVDEFSGDWSHPLNDYDKTQQQVQLGWSLQNTVEDQYDFESLPLAAPSPSPASPDPTRVTQFNDDQKLNAAYAIYQRKLWIFGFQAGLRVEELNETSTRLNPILGTPATLLKRETMVYTPNMILSYKITEVDNLRLTYSRRISRPTGNQLNPQIVFSTDGLSASSGNTGLHPATTDKYDLSYGHDTSALDIGASVYYNDTVGNIEQVSEFLPSLPDILLTTYENAGNTRNAGFSGNLNMHTADRVFQFSFNPAYGYTVWHYSDPTTNQMLEKRAPNSSASLRFTYRPTGQDTFSSGLNYRGAGMTRLNLEQTGQTTLNLSWIHQIIQNKFVLTANLSNLLLTRPSESIRTNTGQQTISMPYDEGPSFMVSLRYTFGQPVNRGQGGYRGPRGGGDGGGPGGGGRGGGGGFGGGGRGGF